MAIVHLICGPIGAGKTTRAIELARGTRAVRFSLDEWIMQLFGQRLSESKNLELWSEHAEICMTQIWTVCRQLLELDIDVILDFGFPGRTQRDRFRQLAIEAGARPKIHVVAGDAAERRARVHARNRDRPATFALVVTDVMFDTSEGWWEPPNPEEL